MAKEIKKNTANIENIELLTKFEIAEKYNTAVPTLGDDKPIVTLGFRFPCKWTTLTIAELLEVLRLWIIAEEMRYPQPQFKGRWLLFDEIKKVFYDGETK